MSKLPLFVALAATSLTLAACDNTVVTAPDPALVQLQDEDAIEDMIRSNYYGLRQVSPEFFAEFYAEDAQLILGATTFEGKAAIAEIYQGTGNSPQRQAYAFNAVAENMLIEVDGDTARARFIFSEYLTENEGDTPALFTQGREFDTLVKRDGDWLFLKRQIVGGDGVPEDWED